MAIKKIAVIGNSGGGKTTLSRELFRRYAFPLTHVDSVQFVAGMKIRPHKESIALLQAEQQKDSWIIDGYGPLDILEQRLMLSDQIIFIDMPIWRHYWWCTKRQIQNLWSPRQELASGCNELSWEHTRKLYRNLWQSHTKMRPELLRILAREHFKNKLIHVRGQKQWNKLFRQGLSS